MQQNTTGDERLAAICQMIRNETLDPALEEAEELRRRAEIDANNIIEQAKKKAEKLLAETRDQIEEERVTFQDALKSAARQTLEILKQRIERELFNPQLSEYLEEEFADSRKTAELISLIIENIKAQGLEGNLSVWLGQKLDKEKVAAHLTKKALSSIPKDGIKISDHKYGCTVKIIDQHLALEITPESIRDRMTNFLRSDFRSYLFEEEKNG